MGARTQGDWNAAQRLPHAQDILELASLLGTGRKQSVCQDTTEQVVVSLQLIAATVSELDEERVAGSVVVAIDEEPGAKEHLRITLILRVSPVFCQVPTVGEAKRSASIRDYICHSGRCQVEHNARFY